MENNKELWYQDKLKMLDKLKKINLEMRKLVYQVEQEISGLEVELMLFEKYLVGEKR